MGGEDQENKQHVCKFCKKSFLCGRSLGGHMRSHMMNNNSSSTKAKEKQLHKKKVFSSFVNGEKNEKEEDFEGDHGQVGYVLRENPKKSWRYSDSSDETLNQDMVCKECGKGFQSWKALFGHMRCHSERDNKVSNSLEVEEEEEEDDSWTTGDQNQKQLIMDSQSDNEATAAAPKRRMRSRRRRYNITATTTTTTTSTTIASSSLSLVHTSTTTCVSEIEQEQEEVALCLMMLSRDVGGYWGGLNSVAEFSDNDSVVVEVRSSGLVDEKNKMLMNGKKIMKMKKPRARKLEFGLKKVESEVSVHGFFGEDSSKRPKLDFEVLEADKSRVQCTGSELIKDLIKEDQADSVCMKYNSSKRTIDDVYNTPKKRKYDGLDESEIGKSSRKKSKYECTTCNKTFHSYQALGGHRASHKKIKGCSLLKLENSENTQNSIDIDVKPIKDCSIEKLMDHKEKQVVVLAESSSVPKNSNKHECPTCFKVFLSGQALGGHKRSHVIESSDIRGGNESINAVQQKLPEIQDLLDLNLPAPIEDDMKDDHIGFKPWWVGSNLKHEAPPVSMISH